MSVPKRKRPRTSSKQNVSTGNSDTDPIVFTTSDTEEKYVNIVKKNLDQFFEIANKHGFQLSIHGESSARVSVRLMKSSGKCDTNTVISEMNKFIEKKLDPVDKHKLNPKEYGYKNDKIFFQQENFQAIRNSSLALESLNGAFWLSRSSLGLRCASREHSPSRTNRILLFLDYLQKDPLLKHTLSGIRYDRVYPKYCNRFPGIAEAIDKFSANDDKTLNVIGSVHVLPVATEKGKTLFGIFVFNKHIVCTAHCSTEDELLAFLRREILSTRLLDLVKQEAHCDEFYWGTHLPVCQDDKLFVHIDKNDVWEENEKVITFIKNNFKSLQYTLPEDGSRFMHTVECVYNRAHILFLYG